MNLIQSSLTHKVIAPRKKTAGAPPALILVHGRGADENDLLGLSEYLDERFLILSVRAPFQFQFSGGYTWYDIVEIGKAEPEMFNESFRKLSRFCDDAVKGYGADPGRLVLLGFSMGTVMSYAMALTSPEKILGVAANSGYIPEGTDLQYHWDKMKGKPFFVTHGLYDPVIPVSFAQRARDLLQGADANIHYREYEMGHQIGEESLNDVMKWLSDLLGR